VQNADQREEAAGGLEIDVDLAGEPFAENRRTLVVQAAGEQWSVTPRSLGVSADVDSAVDRALAVNDQFSLVSRLYHRLWDHPVEGADLRVGYSF